jgi:hypothetical protein
MQAISAVGPDDVKCDNQPPVQQAARVAEPTNYAERRRQILAASATVLQTKLDALPAAERMEWLDDIDKEWHARDNEADLVKDQPRLIAATLNKAAATGAATDASRTGRPRKLPSTFVQRALHLFYKGNGQPGDKWLGYRSISHFLFEEHKVWEELHNFSASVATLWRRLKEEARRSGHPMRKITISYRAGVPKAVLRERLAGARRWLSLTDREFEAIVWIDEKRVYITERGKYRCWAPPDKPDNIQRPAQELLNHDRKLNYIAADSALLGAVYIAPLTGTSGSLGDKGYMVRTCVPARGDLDPASCIPCSPRCLDDAQTVVSILPADAQHAVVCLRCSVADVTVLSMLMPRALAIILPAKVVLAIPVERQRSMLAVVGGVAGVEDYVRRAAAQ